MGFWGWGAAGALEGFGFVSTGRVFENPLGYNGDIAEMLYCRWQDSSAR